MGGDQPRKLVNGADFREWRLEVEMWALGTSVKVEKQGPVVACRVMDKKAKDHVLRLDKPELAKDGGLKIILDALAAHYKQDSTQLVFLAIENIEQFQRPKEMLIDDYIAEFIVRNNHLKETLSEGKEVYHDGILAYRLISQANLDAREKQLIKAAMGKEALSLANVSEALKRCFGDRALNGESSSSGFNIQSNSGFKTEAVHVKQEPQVFYGDYVEEEMSTDSEYENCDTFYNSRNQQYGRGQKNFNQPYNRTYGQKNFNSQNQQSYRHNNSRPPAPGWNSDRYPSKRTKFDQGGHGSGQPSFNRSSREEPQSRPQYTSNARDKSGEVMRCKICDSTKHLMNGCQHRTCETLLQSCFVNDTQESWEPISEDFEYAETYLLSNDTFHRALIDTGAVRNVCGSTWIEEFMSALPEKKKKHVEYTDEYLTFRFGDGKAVKSEQHMILPVTICGKDLRLETFVIPGDIPLLFSRHSMKQFGVQLDIMRDMITIEGVSQDLEVTRSGHYVVDLRGSTEEVEEGTLTLFSDAVGRSAKKTAEKLHSYFGHPSGARLLKLVKDSSHFNKELEGEILKLDKECEHCLRYKKDPAKPKVSIWSPSEVNEVVAMDLKFLDNGLIMFHAIDLFSRFSLTRLVKDKNAETIMTAFFETWVTLMGRPMKILIDNGGEFSNAVMTAACEDLGVELRTTAAHSPFSNGVCERHNGIIADAYYKLKDEMPRTDPAIILAWATNGKNSLANTYGHSPYTLVFGRTPTIPTLDDVQMVTTMNQSTVNKVLADHINCMYQSRLSFMKANNDDKLKRALKGKIPQVEEEYFTGDQVYFKRHNQKRWCGPASVIGKDGKVVFIRQGGMIIRVHETKCVLRNRADKAIISSSKEDVSDKPVQEPRSEEHQKEKSTKVRFSGEVRRILERSSSDSSSGPEPATSEDEEPARIQRNSRNLANVVVSQPATSSSREPATVLKTEPVSPAQNTQMEDSDDSDVTESDTVDEDSEQRITEIQHINQSQEQFVPRWESVSLKNNGVLDIKKNDIIQYRPKGQSESEWKTATVHSYAGKVKGKNNNRFNVTEVHSGETTDLRLNEFDLEKDTREAQTVLYMEDDITSIFAVNIPKTRHHEPGIQKAMQEEMSSWEKYKVYREVPDTNQRAVSTRWVVTEKSPGKFKARLVVRGFEEDGETSADSPTGDKSSTRIVYALAAANSWSLETIDIKAAFLQSHKLDRVVYVKPPRDLKKVGVIWQLEKPAYGLADSSRNWYNSLVTFFLSVGCTRSKTDPAFFHHREQNKLNGVIVLHVDDFLTCGNTRFKQTVTAQLLKKYDISKHKVGNFIYTGVNISQGPDCAITVDQFDYASHVKTYQFDRERAMRKDSDLTPQEKTGYLSLLGKLSWLANITRPDLKWDVYYHSRKNNSATVQDLLDLNGVVSKLNDKKKIRFPKLNLKDGVKIVVHSDASFGNLDNKVNSGRGYIIFLCSGSYACVLAWASNKVRRVVNSTLESETLALLDGLNHSQMLRDELGDILYGSNGQNLISILAFTDSKQLYDSVHSTKQVSDHRLRRDIFSIKERLEVGQISEVRWISNQEMLADPLTKRGACSKKLDLVLDTGRFCMV